MKRLGPRSADFAIAVALLFGAACQEAGSKKPAGPPTLNTGVDPARLAADVAPVVAEWVRSLTTAGSFDVGFTSPADADALQVGRPYGMFTLHKGPWLEFYGVWRAAILVRGEYRSVADIKLEGGKYVVLGLGSTDLASVFASKETQPGLSAALDAGRAALLRRVNEGGVSLVAYEASWPPDTAAPDIRVQSMFGSPVELPGIDGSAGPQESTLAEINETLPDE